MRRHKPTTEAAGIDVTPLLDVVFILLIFFMVTASFTRTYALDVATAPPGAPVEPTTARPMLVMIGANGSIELMNQPIDAEALRPRLARLTVTSDETLDTSRLIVIAEKNSRTDQLVAVLDVARQVGIAKVSVATPAE